MLRLRLARFKRADFAIALGCLALVAGGWALLLERISHERTQTERAIVSRNSDLAIVVEEHVTRTLKGIEQALRLFARRQEQRQEQHVLDINGLMPEGAVDTKALPRIEILDERGDSLMDDARPNGADRPFFGHHRDDPAPAMLVSFTPRSQVTGRPAIQMTWRMNLQDGSYGGVVLASVDPEYFSDIHQGLEIERDAMIQLVSEDGAVLARRAGGVHSTGQSIKGSTLLSAMEESSAGSFIAAATLDDVQRYTSYRRVRSHPLAVSVGTAAEASLQEFHRKRQNYLVAGALVTALTALLCAGLLLSASQREAALALSRRAEARFRATFDHAAVGIAHVTPEGRLLEVNAAFCSMLGHTREGALSLCWRDVVEDHDEAQAGDRDQGAAQEAAPLERLLRRKDCTLLPAISMSTLVKDSDGDYVVTTVQDITKRKTAETQLLERLDELRRFQNVTVHREIRMLELEQEMRGAQGTASRVDAPDPIAPDQNEATMRRALLHILEDLQHERDAMAHARRDWIGTVDALRDPLVVVDADSRIVRANRAYAERAGIGFRELIGRQYSECFPRKECALSASDNEITLESGEIFVSRTFGLQEDGAKGQVLHLFEDVTQRRRDELHIHRLNVLYAILSAVNHAIVECRSRKELAERVVRISTEIGLWQGAWVGFVDPRTRRIVPEAWSASINPYIAGMSVSVDPDVPEGRGPTGTAVRTGEPYFCDDIFADPATLPWRGFAQSFGINTVTAIPLLPKNGVAGVVNLYSTEKGIFTRQVRDLVLEMGGDIRFAMEMMENERMRRFAESALRANETRLRLGLVAMIEAIAATVESRDPYTAGHQRRVAELAAAIAREMGLDDGTVEGVHFGALIHDLGKIQVPAEILAKPTRLSAVEFELIKTHPQAGYDIIKGIDFPWPVAQMMLQHHEKLDGSGYPNGSKGNEIALEARILAVADVVEAMASHRPYRPARGMEAALAEIENKRGKWFDPAVVDACYRLLHDKGFALPKAEAISD